MYTHFHIYEHIYVSIYLYLYLYRYEPQGKRPAACRVSAATRTRATKSPSRRGTSADRAPALPTPWRHLRAKQCTIQYEVNISGL